MTRNALIASCRSHTLGGDPTCEARRKALHNNEIHIQHLLASMLL